MLEILKFIFSSFWVFCGMIILIYIIGMSIAMIAGAISGSDVNVSLLSNNGTRNYESDDAED